MSLLNYFPLFRAPPPPATNPGDATDTVVVLQMSIRCAYKTAFKKVR